MWFSKTELALIAQMGNGNNKVSNIADALKISHSQAYRIGQQLFKKGILTLNNGEFSPERKTHINLLLKIMSKSARLAIPLSGTGLRIFLALLVPKKVTEIEKETALHKTTILKKIREGRQMSLFLKDENRYRLNEKIWDDVREYLVELKKYEEALDIRVPANSIIYHKNDTEIVFSNKDELNAELTAFSAYGQFGIKLLGITYYYYLPKKNLTREEVFMHSIYVAEKEMDIRDLTYIALFLAKYKNALSQVKHPIVANLLRVFAGERIRSYPRLEEIKDRMRVYDIEV